MRRLVLVPLAAAALVAGLSGCGSDSDKPVAPGSPTPQSSATAMEPSSSPDVSSSDSPTALGTPSSPAATQAAGGNGPSSSSSAVPTDTTGQKDADAIEDPPAPPLPASVSSISRDWEKISDQPGFDSLSAAQQQAQFNKLLKKYGMTMDEYLAESGG